MTATEHAIEVLTAGTSPSLERGSEVGDRAAAVYTLVETAKLNGIDPEAWLRDVLARSAHAARSRFPKAAGLQNALLDHLVSAGQE
jgi:hypothetical protein